MNIKKDKKAIIKPQTAILNNKSFNDSEINKNRNDFNFFIIELISDEG